MNLLHSFRLKISLWLLAGTMVPFLALGYINDNITRQNAIDTSAHSMQLNLDNTVEYTNRLLRSVRMTYSSLIASDEFIAMFIGLSPRDAKSTFAEISNVNLLSYQLIVAASANQFIDNIDVYNMMTGGVCSSNSLRIQSLGKASAPYELPDQVPEGLWSLNSEAGVDQLNYTAQVFRFFERETLGIIRFTVKTNELNQLLRKSNRSSECRILCVDEDGRVISSAGSPLTEDEPALISSLLKQTGRSFVFSEGREDLLVVQSDPEPGEWRFFSMAPLKQISRSANVARGTLVALYAAMILVASLIMAVISSAIYRPIKVLSAKMTQFERGDFTSHIQHQRKDEFGQILDRYNAMVRRIDALVSDVSRQTELRKDAIIAMLQTQINKHFLYNTLESIALLAKDEGSDSANRMILSLSKFYRLSLANGRDLITVAELVIMMRHYTDIILTRHHQRLKVDFSCDQSVESEPVLKYIFQPVVENALLHGAEQRVRGGHVRIEFKRDGNKLVFICTDNGPGIPPDKLKLIEQTIRSDDLGQTDLFAISRINYQMRQYYKQGYTFHITSKEGLGTTVFIEIPFGETGSAV